MGDERHIDYPFLCHCGERFPERQALLDHVEEAHPPQIIEQPGVSEEQMEVYARMDEVPPMTADERMASALEEIARILGRIERRMEEAGWPPRRIRWRGPG